MSQWHPRLLELKGFVEIAEFSEPELEMEYRYLVIVGEVGMHSTLYCLDIVIASVSDILVRIARCIPGKGNEVLPSRLVYSDIQFLKVYYHIEVFSIRIFLIHCKNNVNLMCTLLLFQYGSSLISCLELKL